MATFPGYPAATGMASAEALILEAEARRRAALVAVDMEELDALFTSDLVHIHSNAMVHDKAALLHHIETRRAFIAVDRGPLDVRVHGEVALMTGRMINRMRMAGGKTVVLEGMVTQVLRLVDGHWRFSNFQFTLS